jgi:hypothetical protein
MSRRLAWTRQEAETAARDYYSNQGSVSVSNDLLNPYPTRGRPRHGGLHDAYELAEKVA